MREKDKREEEGKGGGIIEVRDREGIGRQQKRREGV